MTAPLSAHHSRAMFDVNELVSVEGVVTKVEWRNPHMWVTLDVPVAGGKIESWGFEGSGAASMVASGISPQVLKVGNRVKIIAHPPRDKSQRTAEFMGMETLETRVRDAVRRAHSQVTGAPQICAWTRT